METAKSLIFDPNTMATTVGANSLNVEAIVSQPIYDPAELKVDGLDYVFDQAKFEEYLSSSSSRISPRLARAHAIICKAQETKGSNRKVWILKSGSSTPRKLAAGQDSENYLARRAAVQTAAPTARQSKLPRQLRDSNNGRAQTSSTRDSHNCRGQTRKSDNCLASCAAVQTAALTARQSKLPRQLRDNRNCRAQRASDRDTPNCLGQEGSPPPLLYVPSASPSTSVFSRLGPKLGIKDHSVRASQQAGGSQQRFKQVGVSQTSGTLIISRLGIPQGVRETIEGNNSKRAIARKVTRDDNTTLIHASTTSYDKRPKVSFNECTRSNSQHSQKKTCPPFKDNVTLGGGSVTHYQAGGGNTRKRTMDQIDCSCSCAQIIKTLLPGCARSESSAHPQRASVFGKLSLPTTEYSKLKSRRLRRRRKPAIQIDELPEVTINMVNKEKGTVTTDSDPDFTPEGKVSARISQRMSQLQLRATRRRDYRRMHEGESSEDSDSDSYSAVASDDTVSSVGQLREAYTITTETLAQMLQEALAKQREELKAEMKMEMELAMQQMRELQNQKIPQPESSQQAGPSRNTTHDVVDSDTEVEDNTIPDPPLKETQSGDDTTHSAGGGNPKQNESESEKMRELEGKINALMYAQEIKKTGIPCPYPREWDSIPYPAKFSLINFTPFDGKGSPTQHLIYFKSHLGVISGNEPLMVRSFVGTLRGAAFDWYRRLKYGSINCWNDMESLFLSNFFDDDTEVSIGTLLDEKQKSGESIDTFVKRFRNKAVNCKDPITEEFILQTCHNNLSIDLLEVMRVVPPTSWKDLKIRGEQAERFLRRKKTERSKTTVDPSEVNFDSHNKENASMIAVDVGQTSKLRPRQQPREQQKASKSEFHGTYSFTDEEVPVIFKYLLDGNKIKLPPITNQEEADKTSDPKYCAYHRRILHPTKDCIALKAIIQALVEAGVLTPK